jgi:hypothetical protein
MKYKVGDCFTWNSIKGHHYYKVTKAEDGIYDFYCVVASGDVTVPVGYEHKHYTSSIADRNTERYNPTKLEQALT